MRQIKTLGFPLMHKEESERRDFLPEFFSQFNNFDIKVILEEGYGEKLGYKKEEYIVECPNIEFSNYENVLNSDIVIVLRCPDEEFLEYMKRDSILISMLHYETRESRNKLLLEKGIHCFSMDAMTNDENSRLVVNYVGTSESGSKMAFNELKKRTYNFKNLHSILNVSIIGVGAVASFSASAFEKLSDNEFLDSNRGLIIHMLPRTITQNMEEFKKVLEITDILVDASKRLDTSKWIVPNECLSVLPSHSIILDLAADPYNTKVNPIQVKGIEGIPTGTLDNPIIEIDDELYSSIPKGVLTKERRVVVSCNAWPGIEPVECMSLYGKQLTPYIEVLLNKGYEEINENSRDVFERSLVRSSLDYFTNNKGVR